MKIIDNLTKINFGEASNRHIQYIVIHYTANDGDTAYGNTKYFKNEYRGASAHYFVDENEICRCVLDKDIAWHCGAKDYNHEYCRNTNSIGIEMCSRIDKRGNYYFLNETTVNTQELVKELMDKYNIPAENVIRHYDVTGKICPKPYVQDENLWKEFKEPLSIELTLEQAKNKLINLGLSDYTMQYLESYKYAQDLITKLAKSIK